MSTVIRLLTAGLRNALPVEKARVHFVPGQFGDALAPSNSRLNSLVLKGRFNSGGVSVLKGVGHLVDGMLSQVSKQVLEEGRNLAVTPG